MDLNENLIKQLEDSNWNENGSKFHIFNSQEELISYLHRSEEKCNQSEYGRYDFEQCVFNFKVIQWINIFDAYVCFKNAIFKDEVKFNGIIFKDNVEFGGCRFLMHVDFSDCIFEKELYPSNYKSSVSFRNAKFKNHVMFLEKKFEGFADFSNSYFEKGVDFADSIFNDEFKICDSKIDDNCFFNGVEFKEKVNGWNLVCLKDISFEWANFRQKANFSDLTVENGLVNLHGTNFEKNAYFYNGIIQQLDLANSVIEKGVYFLGSEIRTAKRETWRIIKHEFIKQNNKIEGLKYHALEMKEYEKELFGDKKILRFSFFRFIRDFYFVFKQGDRTNKFIVFINRISNDYNSKPFRGIVFTLFSTLIFYLLFIWVVKLENKMVFSFSFDFIGLNFKQALQMLNITDWKYTPFNKNYCWAYGVLFIGRIVIGFGIYQTIQAFRKFGRF